MQYSQEHLKTMVYAKFGGQTECIMGNWKMENCHKGSALFPHKNGGTCIHLDIIGNHNYIYIFI